MPIYLPFPPSDYLGRYLLVTEEICTEIGAEQDTNLCDGGLYNHNSTHAHLSHNFFLAFAVLPLC